eukprot:jgi/Botrbrau1/6954/Bobra.0215s0031.1
MLRHLPREPEDSTTLIGCSERAVSGQRHLAYVDLAKEGVVVYTRLFWIQVMIVTDPEIVAEILENPKLYKPVRYFYGVLHPLLDSSTAVPDIATAEGGLHDPLWKVLRKGIAPAFTPQNMRQAAFPVVRKKARAIEDVLRKRGPRTPVEISNAAMCVAIDTIAEWGFDNDLGNIKSLHTSNQNALVKTIAVGSHHCGRRLADLRYNMFGGKGYKEGEAAIALFQNVIDGIYQEMMSRKEELKESTNLAGHLIRLRDPAGRPLTAESIKAQIGVIIFAGHDTTGNTISWTLFLISRYPEIEARVMDELDSLGLLATKANPTPRDFTPDDLSQLPYLDAVIKESMRYMQVVPQSTYRINKEEDVVLKCGLVIPRRTTVYASTIGVHLNPLAFPNPQKFDPERWLEPNAELVKVEYKKWQNFPGAEGRLPVASSGTTISARDVDPAELRQQGFVHRFLPFSYGRRDCVGQNLATLTVMGVLVRLLGNFRFKLAEELVGTPDQVERDQALAITVSPTKGMWMYAEPRTA